MPIAPINTIAVAVTPHAITISADDGQALTLLPRLLVAERPPTRWERILGRQRLARLYGDLPIDTLVSIDLFSSTSPDHLALDKEWCLGVFFRLAFKRLIDTHVFRVRPHVTVTGLRTLDSALAGFQCPLFQRALLWAGARTVTFPEADSART